MVKLGGGLFKGSIQGRMVIKSSFERAFQVCEGFAWDGLNIVKDDPLFSSIFFWLSCVFKWLKFESAFCKFVFAIVASASISACSCSLSLKKAVMGINHDFEARRKDWQIELINFSLESGKIDIMTGQRLELDVGNFEPMGLQVIPL